MTNMMRTTCSKNLLVRLNVNVANAVVVFAAVANFVAKVDQMTAVSPNGVVVVADGRNQLGRSRSRSESCRYEYESLRMGSSQGTACVVSECRLIVLIALLRSRCRCSEPGKHLVVGFVVSIASSVVRRKRETETKRSDAT